MPGTLSRRLPAGSPACSCCRQPTRGLHAGFWVCEFCDLIDPVIDGSVLLIVIRPQLEEKKPMLSDTIVRLIRTWVPIGVGALASIMLSVGVELPAGTAEAITGLVIAGYYAVAALLEQKVHPSFGWLLGYPKER